MSGGPRAVVVGGGIGGLAAAVSLHRVGWSVAVLERAAEFAEVGAGLVLTANALRSLDALGLGESLHGRGMPHTPGSARTPDGRYLARAEPAMIRDDGLAAVGIHRADLHRILRMAVAGDALISATEVVGASADGELTYRCGDTETTIRADLIVGADGLRSAVRSSLWPSGSTPVYAGATAWRAVTAREWAGEPLEVGFTWGRGAEFGVVPLVDGRVYWYAAVNAPEGRHVGDEARTVVSRFGNWHAPIPQLLATTPRDALLRNDIYHLYPPLASFVHGRVALLGDAAHAMTPNLGQGACQGIEDAAVLGAACTGVSASAVPAALTTTTLSADPELNASPERLASPAASASNSTIRSPSPCAMPRSGSRRRASPCAACVQSRTGTPRRRSDSCLWSGSRTTVAWRLSAREGGADLGAPTS